MGGYQLMVAADILRGRFRDSLSNPKAVPADQKQIYRFALPNANHVFLPGHKIMVQDSVQLVSALRSQSTDLRGEHLLREARLTIERPRSKSSTAAANSQFYRSAGGAIDRRATDEKGAELLLTGPFCLALSLDDNQLR